MKTYKATFSAASVLTEIPSAQTLFGALTTNINYMESPEAAEQYLESFQSEPEMIHSSMFPAGLFPMPKQNLFELELVSASVSESKPETKLERLSDFKKFRKMPYISEGVFQKYVLDRNIESLRQDLLRHSEWFDVSDMGFLQLKNENLSCQIVTQLETHNAKKMNEKDPELFYTKQLYPGKEQRFVLFVKTDIPREKLEYRLKLLEYTGVGTKRTVGLNSFHLESLEQIHVSGKNSMRYLLSDCLYDEEIEYAKSYYQIRSDLYRSSKFYNGGYPVGRYNALSTGSMICCKAEKEYYGSLSKVESNGRPVWHYGIGLVF